MELYVLIAVILIFLIVIIYNNSKNRVSKKHVYTIEVKQFDEDEIIGQDKDNWEGGFWEATEPRKLKIYLAIDYVDGEGKFSSRNVRVREYDNGLYGGMMIGHCELRDATRTFRLDRVKKCIDLATGEFAKDIRQYLNRVYEESPERSTDLLVEDYLDVIKVVYFVAKADGQFRREEKAVVNNYIRKLIRDERVSDYMIEEIFKSLETPSIHAFKLAVGKILAGGDIDPIQLQEVCTAIVSTQKVVHAVEKEALNYINKKLADLKDKIA